ncbi:Fur family transcriptional regulator [Qiania dongpingensis]|uniref:Transcriptional repressor n=1 Tax=Qiania dongpingensis TaxID=2763669 RepID=A0A7G9G1C8_9FIRM|nr:transcriptional repressor [Qiania dongpingensis]QNM04610.1 transcriptional repressor [Qiania dongpingensis]
MKTLKYSRQRESIKEFLATRKDHPTADTVYVNIRQLYPNISLGTVYRNLSLLASLGEICKVSCGDGVEHFDSNTEPHYHFICRECGCVQDVPLDPLNDLDRMASNRFEGTIEGHTTLFFGTCRNCTEKVQKTLDKREAI